MTMPANMPGLKGKIRRRFGRSLRFTPHEAHDLFDAPLPKVTHIEPVKEVKNRSLAGEKSPSKGSKRRKKK